MKRTLRYVLFYSALIGLWALLAKLHVWPPYIFPTPWGVAETLRSGFADHSFWVAIAVIADPGASPPAGFLGPATKFVSFTLVPNPSPLPLPGLEPLETVTIPRKVGIYPHRLYLWHIKEKKE